MQPLSLSLVLCVAFATVAFTDDVHYFIKVNKGVFVSGESALDFLKTYNKWFSRAFDANGYWVSNCTSLESLTAPYDPLLWVAGIYQNLLSEQVCQRSQEEPLLVGDTQAFDDAFYLYEVQRQLTFGDDGFTIQAQTKYAVVTPEGWCAEDENNNCINITSLSGQTNRFDEKGNLRVIDYVEDKAFVREYIKLMGDESRKRNAPNKIKLPPRIRDGAGLQSVPMDAPAIQQLLEKMSLSTSATNEVKTEL